MVILEGTTMLQVGNNQYLQPDYLSPLPTSLDAKKSPLALLAQTCSQIGADSGNITVKSLVSPSEKSKNKSSSSSASSSASSIDNGGHPTNSRSPSVKTEKSDASPEIKLAFKPYEMNVLTTKVKNDERPSSKMSSGSDLLNNNSVNHINNNETKKDVRTLSRGSAESPGRVGSVHMKSGEASENGKATPEGSSRKTSSPNDREKITNSPVVRPGSELLQGGKDMSGYKPGAYGINPLTGLPSPSGIDHTNPAFRPPFAGAFSHHHAAMLAAAYPGAAAAAAANPYLSYTRVKTPSGGETLVPICKDPYCTGCQFSAHNHQMMMGGQCPAGCTQCDHQKYSLAMAMGTLPPGYPYPPAATQPGRPYMCNWVMGDSYCGKRFNTTDELLSHLRTHTANLSDPAALALQQQLMPLSGIFPPSSLHRGYPNPPLSPLSAARYHPYAKPGALPGTLPGAPYGAAFNPAAFGQYYSPYAAALYSQRMGAAVHQ